MITGQAENLDTVGANGRPIFPPQRFFPGVSKRNRKRAVYSPPREGNKSIGRGSGRLSTDLWSGDL